jgi:hypothetical protein
MSVETVFWSAVTGDATITAIIAARLYPVITPDDATFPAMAYSVISEIPNGSGGCTLSRVQVDCYATSYATARAMRDGLVALVNATGNWTYVNGPDFWEDDGALYHKVVDVFIAHSV